MSAYILTSMFQTGFPAALAKELHRVIPQAARFAFVASEFEQMHEKTERYFQRFLGFFSACGIEFADACIVDGRMTAAAAQAAVRHADVVWLSGGDTPTQYAYFEKYGLIDELRAHEGVIIGMSAGTINMAETAVCTLTCGHDQFCAYPALGLVPMSVEPHFDREMISEELIELSRQYVLYGLCDEAAIWIEGDTARCFGDVFRIDGGKTEPISFV